MATPSLSPARARRVTPVEFRIVRDAIWDEYTVKHPTNPRADYHTCDKQDAKDTALEMARELGVALSAVSIRFVRARPKRGDYV